MSFIFFMIVQVSSFPFVKNVYSCFKVCVVEYINNILKTEYIPDHKHRPKNKRSLNGTQSLNNQYMSMKHIDFK